MCNSNMYETFVIMSRRCTVQRMCTHCGLLECIAQITYTHSLMAIILMPFFLLCFCRNNCCDARHSNWDQCVVRLRVCECFVVWLSVFLHFCLPIDYYLELPFSLFLFWFLFLLHVFGHSRKRRHCLGFTFIHIYCG